MFLINMWETPPSGQPKFSCACENSKIYWFNIFPVDMASKFWAFGHAHIWQSQEPTTELSPTDWGVGPTGGFPTKTDWTRIARAYREDQSCAKMNRCHDLRMGHYFNIRGIHIHNYSQCGIDPKFKNCSGWFGRNRSFSECDGMAQ